MCKYLFIYYVKIAYNQIIIYYNILYIVLIFRITSDDLLNIDPGHNRGFR